uniref:Sushi domain-containing protein n=1 Tax=Rhodnius prolixus TaxID=13249 RepID=T1HUR2_RHOPR
MANRKILAMVQRLSALRIASAYHTVSEPAITVIAGVIPIALLAECSLSILLLTVVHLVHSAPVRCPTPRVPNKGRLVEDENGGEYGVGSVVQFSCEPSHLLQGEGSIVCTDAGVWSHPPPLCLPVCDYPGEPENGRVIPLKFTYEPGDRLKVTCFDGFVTRLETKLICKSDGTWSQPLPECRNYTSV